MRVTAITILIFLNLIIFVKTIEDDEFKKTTAGFLYSMPKTLLSGKNETVCLSTHYSSALPAKIIIDLKIKEKHFYTTRSVDSEHTCFELYVPRLNLVEPQFTSIRVQVQLNEIIYSAHNQDPVLIYPNKGIAFVESDRLMYKSEDKVRIRILTLDNYLLPQKDYRISEVRIRNPLDITVAVWENVTTELGLAQLEHQLSKDPIEGKWKIESEGETATFEVSKYVLPRFKVEIIHPKIIYYEVPYTTINVCSKYSYGGNVKGTAFLRLTDSHNNTKPIQTIKKLNDGCAAFSFTNDDLSLLHIKSIFSLMDPKIHIHITATVTEYGTDKIELATAKSLVSLKPYTLKFEKQNLFLPGLPYEGKIQLNNVHVDLSEEVIEICYNIAIKRSWNYLNKEQCSRFTVNNEKSIQFHILPLRSNVIHLHLHGRSLNHTMVGDSLLVVRLYSQSSSYIVLDQIHPLENSSCKSIQQFTVKYTTDNFKDHENVTFYYMIKTRGQVHKLRKLNHNVRKHYPNYINDYKDFIGTKHKYIRPGLSMDKFILKFKLDEKIISNYQLLVYYIDEKGEIVAATREVEVEPCLNNHVKANWSHKQITPGGIASLLIQTKSDSLCSISAVDKATKFSDNRQNLNIKSFLKPFLQEKEAPDSGRKSCIPPVKRNREALALTEDEPMWDLRRKKRFVYSFSEDYDTYDIFNNFGIITITNFKVVTKPCYTGPVPTNNKNPVQFLTDQYDVQNEDKIAPIRSYFPETWLWELVPVRGAAVIHRNIPHSITNWVTNVLCVSDGDGVGLSDPTEISSYQPFFVEVLLPYSIKKGELLYLHVVVFNYLPYSIPIRIVLGDSNGLKLVDLMNRKAVSYCISANDTLTHIFELKGTEIGKTNVTILAELDAAYPGECGPDVIVNKRDIVFKTLLVEPEGHPVKITKSAFLCSSNEDSQFSSNITWDIETPENIVPSTAKAQVTLNGDLLGQTIENLEELILMPTGCGEQIMASLAPNLYALRYLNITRNLTPSTKHRIIRNLKIGYQRILNYVHKDGSFSAFGYHDPVGSMFLTAFVVRTLQEAKEFIYVDQRIIDKAVSWILDHQLENGCFSTMLHVFQDMGGTSTENSTAGLTSYVMISLLEANIEIPESIKTNAKYCIRGHYHLDKYTLAISSYALFKVNWYSEGMRMLKKLIQISNQKDNMMWWTNRDMNGSLATDVEITSYVLLSLLHLHTQENLVTAHSVVRWLSTKQGPRGGFKSTQDTVVALDALTKYSRFLLSKPLNLEVNVETKEQNHLIKIKREDRLKSKKIVLRDTSNNIKIFAKGEGCILAQTVLSYYVKHLPNSNAFKLDMDVSPVSNIDPCSIANISPCFSYNGPDTQANMAILEINLPSGYEADRVSLYKLLEEKANEHVKKFEEQNQKIIFYLTKLNKKQVCIAFNINENAIVQSRSESLVKIYDYYKPEYNVLQYYKIDDKCKLNNLTMPEIINTAHANSSNENEKIIVKKRNINTNFVNMDIDLDEPEGTEGNIPTYVKLNSTMVLHFNNSIAVDTTSDLNLKFNPTRSKRDLNPDFVNKDYEMALPNGMEGNKPSYTRLTNNSKT